MKQIDFLRQWSESTIKDLIKQLCEACEETGIVKGQMAVLAKENRELQARAMYAGLSTIPVAPNVQQIEGKVPIDAVRKILAATSADDPKKRINLVKLTRELTGLGLIASRDVVDEFYGKAK